MSSLRPGGRSGASSRARRSRPPRSTTTSATSRPGWRISDMLGLRREDLDIEGGYAVTRWSDNKGKRDERVKLHPVVVEHLRKLPGFTPTVFPWPHNVRTLYD